MLLLLTGSFAFAQGPAGSAFYVDYDQFQMDNLRRYLNCGNNGVLNPGTSVTMEAWIRVHDSNWNQKIFGKLNPSFNSGYMLAIDQGKCYPEVWTPGHNDDLSGFVPPLGYWYHFAVTATAGDSMKSYVNGELTSAISIGGTSIAANNDDFIIGIAPWDLQNFQYFGYIDEVRIWSTARSQQDIMDYMFVPLDGSELGLMTYYDFNGITGPATVPDRTSNANDCSWTNGDASNIASSNAVIGDATIETMDDLHGLWNGNGFTNPRVALTDNGLSLVDTLADWDYVVFGHNGGLGVSISDLPSSAPVSMQRTDRVWYLNEVGSTTPNFSMDLANASGGGAMLNTTLMASQYYLLFRSGASGNFSVVAAADVKNGNTLVFNDVDLETGYYTLAASEDPLGLAEQKSMYLELYPNPSNGALNFKVNMLLQGETSLQVYNVLGEQVYSEELAGDISHQEQELDLQGLPQGTYFLHLQSGSDLFVKRFQVLETE